jgi:hypothetical protein
VGQETYTTLSNAGIFSYRSSFPNATWYPLNVRMGVSVSAKSNTMENAGYFCADTELYMRVDSGHYSQYASSDSLLTVSNTSTSVNLTMTFVSESQMVGIEQANRC